VILYYTPSYYNQTDRYVLQEVNISES